MKNTKTLLVSVIISAFNEEEHIGECLSTLRTQTYHNMELIVVDDGSRDATILIATKYADKVISQQHKGLGVSRNKGAGVAKGDVIVFLDADMYFDKNFIARLVKPILSKKAYATFMNEEYLANADNVWVQCGNIDNNIPQGLRYSYEEESLTVRAIRKNLFNKLGGMKTNLGYRDDNIFLSTKYRAISAIGAISYHYNPSTLKEIFFQARWVGRNPHISKNRWNLFRYSLINSLVNSYKKIKNGAPFVFCFYKLVFDFGIFCGILSSNSRNNYAK